MKPPLLSKTEIKESLALAADSQRRRYPKILHESGANLNRVINFLMADTYMQPHLHPSAEKVEMIMALEGKLAVLFFDNGGNIIQSVIIEKGGVRYVEVPAFAWHTYVVLSDTAVTYETMPGVYDPKTWKILADWAPREEDPKSSIYLKSIKTAAINQ